MGMDVGYVGVSRVMVEGVGSVRGGVVELS